MDLYNTLQDIVQQAPVHSKWLNTLSYMENAGARKISACEHTDKVNLIQLKHAAEEHRHAYYLKKQIGKINPGACLTYQADELLAPIHTKQYLHQLDVQACRYLKQTFGLQKEALKYAAYLFVTYAIEVRADELYPVYQEVLTAQKQKVMVKSIILEEEGHLEEMIQQLQHFAPDWQIHAAKVQEIEHALFTQWMRAIQTATLAHA
ncbi:hypothetical protein DBR32_02785 [Taibaiella sp. KBW10]|uniref:hypothetical protein n=1 Tax=Taibaiella sp. KBW10 TaxID=2153357 RepID=UPI000F5B0E29|nr:hypothetical protein [Taibaiella sp. KBW10]RQO32541.1 hypothetical protein DBR32_02785 [Taibaiella sp. KBW10]